MKKIIAAVVAAAAVALPVHSDPLKDNQYFTMHSMGCMLLQECVEDVKEINSISDINSEIPAVNYDIVTAEFNSFLRSLDKIGVKVFLADQKYFPVGHRGVYHTVSNNFFLNKAYMHRPGVLMSVMRHEGWHAAQDCMAGTIKNNMIAIILPEDTVPPMYQEIVKRTYKSMPHAIPWEKEAYWAGKTEGMTARALESCARGTMWTDYEPTPLTRQYLVEKGYLSK
tara:strand:- start:80 stop:754 length:675 start_codon:yes stop_codon:yes gene_type:complete